jgi:hypothetical protein
MKKTFLVAALALLTVGMVSCKKEENNISKLRFTATMESGAKTSLSGQNLTWDGNEKIVVFGTTGSGIFAVDPDESDASVATFACESGEPGSGPFKAFYPQTLSTDGVNIVFPAVQSTTGDFANYPMYAESSTTDLLFKNICSVLRLNLQKNDASVTKIQIVTDHYQTGTFRIQMNEAGVPELEPANTNNHTKIVTLEFDDAVSIATARDFFIYLIPGSYTHMVINLYNGSNLFASKTFHSTTSPLQFNRSAQKSLTFGNAQLSNDQTGALSGLFTVNSNGKKVMFSKSNLFQNRNTSQYRFADEQYNNGLTIDDHQHRSVFLDTVAHLTSYNIANGAGTWYCLSEDEWIYLTWGKEHRNVTYRYLFAKVTRYNSSARGGLIIFPDQFVWPLDESKLPADKINKLPTSSTGDWNGITFSYNDWKTLENAGFVFLPVTGGINSHYAGEYEDRYVPSSTSMTTGQYWTTTGYDYLWIQPRTRSFESSNPTGMRAIRLVKDAPTANTAK